ncbi:hypothetical protein SS50377_23729 [Spironucleus salmonicida]|uniref:Uncharacterized protein n=1 Tax=Spironucleus salmonicida TaxID=348837 RepID=V6LQ84_9EUKA|nr:hypothetical protein SS50377_23729 [Spironucleus salmonicida]|eukprot:EST46408.1 Hypothetical protein SS50377_13492 [Spironucleus salmonicida]
MNLSTSNLTFSRFSQASQIASIQPIPNYDNCIALYEDNGFPKTTFKSQQQIQLTVGQPKDIAVSFLATNGHQYVLKTTSEGVTVSCSPLLEHITEQVWVSKIHVQSGAIGSGMCQLEICLGGVSIVYVILYFETQKDFNISSLSQQQSMNQSQSINNSQLYQSQYASQVLPVQAYQSPVINHTVFFQDAFINESNNNTYLPQSAVFNSKLSSGSTVSSFPPGEVYAPSVVSAGKKHHSKYCYDSGLDIPESIIQEAKMSILNFSQVGGQSISASQQQISDAVEQDHPQVDTWVPTFEVPEIISDQKQVTFTEASIPKQFISPLYLDEMDDCVPFEKSFIDSEPQENLSDIIEEEEFQQIQQPTVEEVLQQQTVEASEPAPAPAPEILQKALEPSKAPPSPPHSTPSIGSQYLLTQVPSKSDLQETAQLITIPNQLFFPPANQLYSEIAKVRIKNPTQETLNLTISLQDTVAVAHESVQQDCQNFKLDKQQISITGGQFQDLTVEFAPRGDLKPLVSGLLMIKGEGYAQTVPLFGIFGLLDLTCEPRGENIVVRNSGEGVAFLKSENLQFLLKKGEEKEVEKQPFDGQHNVFVQVLAGMFEGFLKEFRLVDFVDQVTRIQQLTVERIE